MSTWRILAFGMIIVSALSIIVLRTYALRVKWTSGSLELVPAEVSDVR